VACRRLAMVQLAQRGLGTHEDIASAFGLKSLSVDRYRKAFRQQGLVGLLPKKKGPKGPRGAGGKVDKGSGTGKRGGKSSGERAGKRGIGRPAVRDASRRAGDRVERRQAPMTKDEPSAAEPPDVQDVQAIAFAPGTSQAAQSPSPAGEPTGAPAQPS